MGKVKGNESNKADELRIALTGDALLDLLGGSIGAFSVRQLFINEYINYINQIASNPGYSQDSTISIKNYDLEKLIPSIKKIFTACFSRANPENEPKDILILSRKRIVKVKTPNGVVTGDYIFFSIAEDLKEKHPDIGFVLYQLDDQYFAYDHITPIDLIAAAFFALKKNIQWQIHKREILSDISAKGSNTVASCLRAFFSIRPLIRTALMAHDFKNMIGSISPKIILSNDDCFYTKPVNHEEIAVLVMQSAGMVEALEECRSLIFEENALLPEYYLSSGTFFSEIKSRHHIARSVIATGLPRYDVLYNAPLVYNRGDFFRAHKIDPKRRMLMWATQSHAFSPIENSTTVKAILEAIKELPGVILVIKQHPAEGEEHRRFLQNMITEYQSDAIIAAKDSDTYELLSVCDLHITRTSTTAREAVAMNKPVIIFSLNGQDDKLEYVKEGVALGIYSSEKLKSAIESLLEDDSKLSQNRSRYIEKYLYRIDGKSTERVVNLLIQSPFCGDRLEKTER